MKIFMKIANYFKNKYFFSNIFNSTLKHIGVMFLAQSLSNIFNYAYNIVMGRMLGPSNLW